MEFKYKTIAEITALSDAEKDVYSAEKRTHEANLVKAQIEDATKSLKDANTRLEDTVKTQGIEMARLKENVSSSSNVKKGVVSEFFAETTKEYNKDDKYLSNKTVIKAAALMTTANITPVTTGGFSPLFTNYFDNEVGETPKPDNFIMSLVDVRTQLGTEAIYYSDRVNEEGDAEFIGEGTLKPLIDGEWKTSKKNIKEVALRWKFTKRLMQHAPSVEADFREHANQLIEQKMDDVALSGDESVNVDEFDGIAALSDAFVVPASLALYYDNANIYDVINAVATFVRLNNFKGNLTCVLGTVWKAKMQGIKNDNGDYIIPPFVTQDGNTVGETMVRFENKMPEAKILLGDLKKYKIVIAETVSYDEGYENDDFSKNLVSRKLEAFMGSYKKDSDAGSIVYEDIATVLTAISKVII